MRPLTLSLFRAGAWYPADLPASLRGLVRHLTEVERSWFRRVLAGQHAPPLYYGPDDEDGDFDGVGRGTDHPDAAVVAYVNSSAAVKAVADVCCTSANAVQVVNSLDQDEVIFVPDRNLAAYVAARTEKSVFPVPATGCCPVHQALTAAEVRAARAAQEAQAG